MQNELVGLYYLRARYLNAANGRFWNADSYQGKRIEPTSLHKYVYGSEDPINNIDPTGRFTITQTQAVVSLIAVAAITSYKLATSPSAQARRAGKPAIQAEILSNASTLVKLRRIVALEGEIPPAEREHLQFRVVGILGARLLSTMDEDGPLHAERQRVRNAFERLNKKSAYMEGFARIAIGVFGYRQPGDPELTPEESATLAKFMVDRQQDYQDFLIKVEE